jgi:glycerol-3-phosphate dehydrogenase (NAD(P)+)
MAHIDSPMTVIGAGAWGTALALLLARNGSTIRLWGNDPLLLADLQTHRENRRYLPGHTFPENLHVVSDLKESLSDVRDILIVVPSHAFRDVLEKIKPHVQSPRIAWGTKGLDPTTRQLLHQVVFDVFSEDTPIAALSGPSFAAEVADEKPTAVSLAGNDLSFIEDLIERFHNKHFRVYQNADLIGLQLCGTLKNIMAIAVGIADGLDLGANARSAIITRGLVEMGRLCEVMGAQSSTLLSLAGVGDLVLTCTDNQSRNRRFGMAIAKTSDLKAAEKEIGQAVEGLKNTKQVYELAKSYGIEMPITEQIYAILHKGEKPESVVSKLLSRAPKWEDE